MKQPNNRTPSQPHELVVEIVFRLFWSWPLRAATWLGRQVFDRTPLAMTVLLPVVLSVAELHGELHVLPGREERDQVPALEHDPDPAGSKPRSRGVVHLGDVLAVEDHPARVGEHEAGEHGDERGLPAAGHAGEAGHLPAGEIHADAAKHWPVDGAVPVGLRDHLEPRERSGGPGLGGSLSGGRRDRLIGSRRARPSQLPRSAGLDLPNTLGT